MTSPSSPLWDSSWKPEGLANVAPKATLDLTELQALLGRTEGQAFRERVGFVVLCVVGAYCSMRLLVELKSILEPFLWALFLVMAWKPVVDGLERRIESLLVASCRLSRGSAALGSNSSGGATTLGGAAAAVAAAALGGGSSSGAGGGGGVGGGSRGRLGSLSDDEDNELQPMIGDHDLEVAGAENRTSPWEHGGSSSSSSRRNHASGSRNGALKSGASNGASKAVCMDLDEDWMRSSGNGYRRTAARGLAVVAASMGMLGLCSGFGMLILESARHMRDHWDVYQKGAERLTRDTKGLFAKVPANLVTQYTQVSADMVKTAQDVVYGLLGDFVNHVSSLLFGVMLTMLYTLFWLCSPVPMDTNIDIMFRKYIMFKTLACFGYGVSVGLLLAALSIDLASVFALTTFALNYVPEVGPFMAMLLPCPVILLDSRLERPTLTMFLAIAGQFALKFAFSNIIEVKLIESDKKLRMHPVMILLSVGIFGHLWGPTGMLLSVPLMALLKISLFSDLVPASYRDPILVVLEGDREAPVKHGLEPPTASPLQRVHRHQGSRRAPPGG